MNALEQIREREREKSKIVYWNLHYHIYIQNVGPIHWKLYYRPYPLKTLVVYILSIGPKHAKHWLYTCKALMLYIATNFWYIYNTILISGQIHGRYVSNKLTISLGMIRYEPLHLLILIGRISASPTTLWRLYSKIYVQAFSLSPTHTLTHTFP